MFSEHDELIHHQEDSLRLGLASTKRSYMIQEHIGSGGMGEVYRVFAGHLGRQVALKVIPRFSQLPRSDRDRIEFEQDTLQRISEEMTGEDPNSSSVFSSNIVLFHEVGRVVERDLYYISMEFVDGSSLRELIPKIYNNGNPKIDLIYPILSSLLRGLNMVHNKSIVHRDLKPSNILIPIDKGQPRYNQLKISDFGISFNLTKDERNTIPGMTIGTPDYMSPEQCRGEAVGPGADIYAVGIILYEMLTGNPPFSSRKAIETMQNHVSAEVVSPSRALGVKADSIPPRLEGICLRCLKKDPKDRYRSASDLIHELASFYREYQGQQPHDLQSRILGYCKLGMGIASRFTFTFRSRKASLVLVLLALLALVFGLSHYVARMTHPKSETFLGNKVLRMDNSSVEKLDPLHPFLVDVDLNYLDARQPLFSFELDQASLVDRLGLSMQPDQAVSSSNITLADTIFLEDERGNRRTLVPKFDRGVQFINLDEPLVGKRFRLFFKTKEHRAYHKIAVASFYVIGIEVPEEIVNAQ